MQHCSETEILSKKILHVTLVIKTIMLRYHFWLTLRIPLISSQGKGRMNTYWLTDINEKKMEEFWNLPGRTEEIRGRASLNSMPEENENAAIKFEPEASGSTPLVTRRKSSAAIHATTAV